MAGKTKKQCACKERITLRGVEITGYVSLLEPSTMFDARGVYSLTVLLDEKEAKKLQTKINKMIETQENAYGGNVQAFKRLQIPFVKVIKDKESGKILERITDPQGRAGFKLDTKAYIKDGKIGKTIGVFDAKGKPITGDISINQGSIVNVVVDLEGYTVAGNTGVSVKLAGVQVIKLESFNSSGASFDSLGFTEEDGFVMSDEFVDCDSEVDGEEEEEI